MLFKQRASFFEVYPSGSLKQWNLLCRAYKGPGNLTAPFAATGLTLAPDNSQRGLARSEDWIHLPSSPPA